MSLAFTYLFVQNFWIQIYGNVDLDRYLNLSGWS